MKKSLWLSFIVLLMGVLIFAGCSNEQKTNTNVDANTPSVDANTPDEENGTKDDKTLTIAMGADMVTFDIHNHLNTSTEAIHINMFSYLLKNEDSVFTPDLATDWTLIEDDLWEFNLREGVKFHNGDELTSKDVKFTLERVANDESLADHQNYLQIKEVEIIDDYTFRIHTHGPLPTMLNRLSRLASGILPSDYIEENGWDHFLSNPVGSGPYQFVEWKRDDRVVLEIFEDYYNGRIAEWDTLVFRSIPEASTRVAEVLTGGVDIANNISPSDWDRINENEGTSVITGPTNRTMNFFLRHNEGYPTSDVRVRKAIDLAIDDQAVIDYVMGGSGTPTRTRILPGNTGFYEPLYDTYLYDVEEAKKLMAEAGYEDGFEMTIHSPNGRYLQDRESVEVMAGMLSEIGIKVKLDFMEWSAFVTLRDANAQEDMYLIGNATSLWDAAQGLEYYHSRTAFEHTGYKNEEVDKLLEAAEINMDPEERNEQYKKVNEIAADELPNITLYQLNNFYGVNDRINFVPRIDEMWRVEEITSK